MARTDAQRLEVLLNTRDQIDDLILSVTTRPKPTYTVDGQTFKWAEYLEILRKQRDAILLEVAKFDRPGGLTMTQVFTGQ
jgi:hypothetical protein